MANFALVVIDPFQVDFVKLDINPNHRTKFTRDFQGWGLEELGRGDSCAIELAAH
jgi:hypothetical protein